MHRATPFPQQPKSAAAANPQKRKAAEPLVKPPSAAAAHAPPGALAAASACASRPQAQLRPAGTRPQPPLQTTIRQSHAGAAAPAAPSFVAPPRKPPPLLHSRPPPPLQRKIITVPRAAGTAAAAAAASKRPTVPPKLAIPPKRPAAPIDPPPPQQATQPDARATRASSKKKDTTAAKPQRQGIEEEDLPFEQSQKHAAKPAKPVKPAEPAKQEQPNKRYVLDLTEDAKDTEEEEEAGAEAQAERDRPLQTLTEWLESSPRASPEPAAPTPQADPIRTFGHPDVLSVVVILGEERDALEAELHRPGREETDDTESPEPVHPSNSLFPFVLRLLHSTHGLTWSCLCGALPLHCSWSRLRRHIRFAHGGVEEADKGSPSPSSSATGDDNEDSEMQTSGDEAEATSAAAAASSATHQLVALPTNLRALPPREPSHAANAAPSSTWPPTRRRRAH